MIGKTEPSIYLLFMIMIQTELRLWFRILYEERVL